VEIICSTFSPIPSEWSCRMMDSLQPLPRATLEGACSSHNKSHNFSPSASDLLRRIHRLRSLAFTLRGVVVPQLSYREG
jgi:hypothetical protein